MLEYISLFSISWLILIERSLGGHKVRARARWVEDGDSSSAYFLRLEKKRGADRKISALSGMARRKAPGLNGVPMEFYLHFWDILGDHLVAVLLSSILKLVYFDS